MKSVVYQYNVVFTPDKTAREYFYFAYEEYELGDMVVVDTHRGLAVACISSVAKEIPDIAPERLRTIVCAISVAGWMEKERKRLGE